MTENYTGSNSHVTNFLYDGSNVAQEQNTSGSWADVLNGLAVDDHFARTSGGVTMYFLTDALGSTVALTDSSGAIQTRYSYSAFGYTVPSGPINDNPYQFAGREVVDNTGGTLYYNRSRYLDTFYYLRFLSRDPLGLSGGSYLALYAYAGNSPLNGTDPTGAFVVGGVPSIGLPNWGSGWWGLPGGVAGVALGGNPDATAVMIGELDAVSPGMGEQLAMLAGDSYADANVTIGFGPALLYLGVTGGVQLTSSGYYPYLGGAFVYPPGASGSLTLGDSVTHGWQVGLQGVAQGVAGQVGIAFGSGFFWEVGTGLPAGLSLTGYYVFGPFNY